MPERQTPTTSSGPPPKREAPSPARAPAAIVTERPGGIEVEVLEKGEIVAHRDGDDRPPPARRKEKRKDWLELLAGWLHEASVLVLVFGFLDPFNNGHGLTRTRILWILGISVFAFVVSAVIERYRPLGDEDE